MSYTIHKIYGRIKDLGLQGFQFNYPVEGAVFDITEQRFVMMTKGLSDESLMQEFIAQIQYGHKYLDGKWRNIGEIINYDIINSCPSTKEKKISERI